MGFVYGNFWVANA